MASRKAASVTIRDFSREPVFQWHKYLAELCSLRGAPHPVRIRNGYTLDTPSLFKSAVGDIRSTPTYI